MRGRSVGVGFAWASAGRLTLQASNLVALMITSRFITPLEFGLFAPVVILASLIYAASEGAFATALMQRVELTDDHDLDKCPWPRLIKERWGGKAKAQWRERLILHDTDTTRTPVRRRPDLSPEVTRNR